MSMPHKVSKDTLRKAEKLRKETGRQRISICTNCHYRGQGGAPGSFLIEIILWCCYIIPGLIYSIWRIKSRGLHCPQCKKQTMIPVDTPRGRAVEKQFYD